MRRAPAGHDHHGRQQEFPASLWLLRSPERLQHLGRLYFVLFNHNLCACSRLGHDGLVLLGYRADRRRESIASSRQRHDILAAFRSVSQRLAQQEDVLAQVRFFDNRIWPDLFQKLFFRDHVAAAANQGEERLEGFGCDGNGLVSPQQDLLVGVHVERPEFVHDPGSRSHRLKCQQLGEPRNYPLVRVN